MIVEFIGLPGAGKTTLFTEVGRRLAARGLPCVSLRLAAAAGAADVQQKHRFLSRKPNRQSLFGFVAFAQKYPELMDHLYRPDPNVEGLVLWNLETLSQMHFARIGGVQDKLVIADEGLVHRGVAMALDQPDDLAFARFLKALPSDFALIHLDVTPERALENALGRDRKLPPLVQASSEHQALERLQRLHELNQTACRAYRNSAPYFGRVNGMQPIAESANLLEEHLMAIARDRGLVATPSLPKRRKSLIS